MELFDYKLLLLRLIPEIVLVAGGVLILFLDPTLARSWPARKRSIALSVFSALIALIAIARLAYQHPFGSWLDGMFVGNPANAIVQEFILILSIFSLLISPADKFSRHLGEYYSLVLFGTVGLLLMAGAEDLLMAFIGLETASLTLYVLAGFYKTNVASAEAAMKYFLFGSAAAGFTLFGLSLIFGFAGGTSFASIAASLGKGPLDPLLLIAICLTIAGFAFKIAAVPMQFWAPDVYEGAPIPSAALIASGSKLAGFFLFARLFTVALPHFSGSAEWGRLLPGWMPALAVISLASMIFGNLVAIAQSNLRRLLAYSAIAHGGYALLGLLASSERGLASVIYYMFTYGLAIIGIFGIVAQVERRHGMLRLEDLAGLSRRSPCLAVCLMTFVLSLAGIPPLAGFFGKFYLFLALLQSTTTAGTGLIWLVVVAIATSAVSLYYYLQILKQAWVVESREPIECSPVPWPQTILLLTLAGSILAFGCFPHLLLNPLETATHTSISFPLPSK
jgi:NADH-quinone oxidoreductase subunit N